MPLRVNECSRDTTSSDDRFRVADHSPTMRKCLKETEKKVALNTRAFVSYSLLVITVRCDNPPQGQMSVMGCNANLPQSCATVHPSGKREERVIRAACGGSAFVHATRGATVSRFAGRSANRTPPITMVTITSVKFLWTP